MKNIVAFGNPLLDTIVFINDNHLLNKYKLSEDGQKEVNQEEMKLLTQDIESEIKNKNYTAGGCAQNTLRVLQWLSKKKYNAFIFGSVGKDDDAIKLKNLMECDGVNTKYIVHEHLSTGKTISLVNAVNRSLVAHLGAAEYLSTDSLLCLNDFRKTIHAAEFVYIEGYFLTKREDVAKYVLNLCSDLHKILIFNISGEYVCDLVPKTLQYFVENCDIVIGNRKEFEALRKIMNYNSIEELIEMLMVNGKSRVKIYGNIYIMTDGGKPGHCFCKNGLNFQFDIEEINKNEFKDSTGAGDAFVGGLLAKLLEEKSIQESIKSGCHAASIIIKQIGCSIPN